MNHTPVAPSGDPLRTPKTPLNMNSTVRNLLIVAAVVLAALLIWKYVISPAPSTPADPVVIDTPDVAPPVETLDPDTGAGAPSYPTYPEAGEKTDIDFAGSATVYDRPCLYVSRLSATSKFKVIDVVIPHAAGKRYALASGSPTTSGGVITYTFNEVTDASALAGLTVYVDAAASTRSTTGISKVRAVATKAGGGGSDDDDIVVGGSDDESTFPTWTSAVPFIWHKAASGTSVIIGGFVYGMGGNKPTAATAPPPTSGGTITLNTTTVSAGKMYQAIPQLTFTSPSGNQDYMAESVLSTAVPDRTFRFQR